MTDKDLQFFIFLWALLSLFVAVGGGAWLSESRHDARFAPVGKEGRVVLAIFAAPLWPLAVIVSVAWAVWFLTRGVAQVVRWAIPRRVKSPSVPKAQVRR